MVEALEQEEQVALTAMFLVTLQVVTVERLAQLSIGASPTVEVAEVQATSVLETVSLLLTVVAKVRVCAPRKQAMQSFCIMDRQVAVLELDGAR